MTWLKAKLGDITTILSGTTPKSEVKAYWNGSHTWITPTDLGKLKDVLIQESERLLTDEGVRSCNLNIIPKGSVVMSSRAPIGHLGIANKDLYTNQGCKSFVCSSKIDTEFLYFTFLHRMKDIQELGSGATFVEVSKSALDGFEISFPDSIKEQRQIASKLKAQQAEVDKALNAAELQWKEIQNLANSIINESIRFGNTKRHKLGDVLREIKKGIGESWEDFPVLGATRNGLALAKEPPGKTPQRYKPVVPCTVFYNPMRILIGSIAMVDDDDTPGITSPDYVVLQGEEGLLDSRWFYFWLRSPLGEQCINSLARGAVRERMLFNRLAEGEIELPEFYIQKKASESLKELVSIKKVIKQQMDDIKVIPNKLLAQAFKME